MRCAWDALLKILPIPIREDVDRLGRDNLQELRLRINAPPELVTAKGSRFLAGKLTSEDLSFVVNTATRYSPWTAHTAAQGYITAPGGHRIGLCGEVVVKDGTVSGIRAIHSLCIRVARDFCGIAGGLAGCRTNLLILGPPGSGKTTLLRDLIRQLAEKNQVAVVDGRGELFPEGFQLGLHQDTLYGCPKDLAIERLLRTMGPDWIAVDEITGESDAAALLSAARCGVRLAATAHGFGIEDLRNRKAYRPLWENRIFQTVLVMNRDKAFTMERMMA